MTVPRPSSPEPADAVCGACGHPHVNPDGSGTCSRFLCGCREFVRPVPAADDTQAERLRVLVGNLITAYMVDDGKNVHACELAVDAEIDRLAADLEQTKRALRETLAALELWENAVGEINVWPPRCRHAVKLARAVLGSVGPDTASGKDEG